jgi:peptidyl-prolyl cis-trans isomerase SurA
MKPARILPSLFLAIGTLSTLPAQTDTKTPSFAAERFVPGATPRNSIIAVVEGKVITEEQVRRIMLPSMSTILRKARNKAELDRMTAELVNDIIQKLIDDILIVHDFREQGFQIPKTVIENQYKQAIQREFGGDRSRFLRFLRDQSKTVRQYREELEEKMIIQSMAGRMRKTQAEISPQKIEEYYRKNKVFFFQDESLNLSQITLVPHADANTEQLKQTAERIVQRLDRGEDFAKLARLHSRDDRRKEGGDYGWIKRTDLRKELSDLAFTLKAGNHSQPYEVDGYVFILKVNEKRNEGIQPLEEVRGQIEKLLSDEAAREAQKAWLLRLRKKAHIQFF